MLLRTARKVVVCCFVLFSPTIFLLLSFPPHLVFIVLNVLIGSERRNCIFLQSDGI